jgi:hypothetical protein
MGGASGKLRAGVTSVFQKDTPMPNLLLTMLDFVGVHQDKSAIPPAISVSRKTSEGFPTLHSRAGGDA